MRDAVEKGICDRGATKPWGILGATRRAAVLFGSRFVARSSQTTAGMLVARRLAGAENPSRQTVSYLGYRTLDQQLRSLEKAFLAEGGPRQRITRARLEARRRPDPQSRT